MKNLLNYCHLVLFIAFFAFTSNAHPSKVFGLSTGLAVIIAEDGKVFEYDFFGRREQQWTELTDLSNKVVRIDAHVNHLMALTNDGKVFTWGGNAAGQLGHGNKIFSEKPREVVFPKGTSIVEIACGGSFSCALSSDGVLYVWGECFGSEFLTPTPVNDLRFKRILYARYGTLFVLDGDDNVYTWYYWRFFRESHKGDGDELNSPKLRGELSKKGITAVSYRNAIINGKPVSWQHDDRPENIVEIKYDRQLVLTELDEAGFIAEDGSVYVVKENVLIQLEDEHFKNVKMTRKCWAQLIAKRDGTLILCIPKKSSKTLEKRCIPDWQFDAIKSMTQLDITAPGENMPPLRNLVQTDDDLPELEEFENSPPLQTPDQTDDGPSNLKKLLLYLLGQRYF